MQIVLNPHYLQVATRKNDTTKRHVNTQNLPLNWHLTIHDTECMHSLIAKKVRNFDPKIQVMMPTIQPFSHKALWQIELLIFYYRSLILSQRSSHLQI